MSTETTNKKIKIDNGTTFGKTYTDKAIDAKLPTDLIASANKLSLGVGNSALGNGVNLDGFTYDEATKTLKAEGSGATLPAGTESDPFKIGVPNSNYYTELFVPSSQNVIFRSKYSMYLVFQTTESSSSNVTLRGQGRSYSTTIDFRSSNYANVEYRAWINDNYYYQYICVLSGEAPKGLVYYNKETTNRYAVLSVPKDKTESYYLEGTYDATSKKSAIEWHALKKTSNHYIVISDGTASNAIYLLIPSTNSLICSSLPELNTLLGNTNRFIQASGVVTDTSSKLPIVAINWQGSFSSSKIVTMSSEEATTKFTDISDIVEPA